MKYIVDVKIRVNFHATFNRHTGLGCQNSSLARLPSNFFDARTNAFLLWTALFLASSIFSNSAGDALDAEGALAAPMGDALHSTWMKEGNILVGQKHC